MKIYGDPKKVEEYGVAHQDAVDVEGVVIVGYDPDIHKWLALEWDKHETIWLAGGGRESSESYEQAATRELKEETGYSDYQEIIQRGGPIISHYYNSKKDSHRRSYSFAFLFLLDSRAKGQPELEQHEKFSVKWLDYESLRKAI